MASVTIDYTFHVMKMSHHSDVSIFNSSEITQAQNKITEIFYENFINNNVEHIDKDGLTLKTGEFYYINQPDSDLMRAC